MAYYGRNRKDLLRTGDGAREPPIQGLQQKEHSAASFAFVTSMRAPLLPATNPFKPPRTLVDCGPLDEPLDAAPQASTQTLRKRKPIQSKGRISSLGRFGDYEDEEDVAYHNVGEESEESIAKRKKPAPIKCSQSTKTALSTIAKTKGREEEYEQDEQTERSKDCNDSASTIHLRGEEHEEQASLLTKCPKPVRRKTGRAGCSIPKERGNIGGLFQNSSITKQSISQEKKPSEKARSSHVINRHWMTTENTMKPSITTISATKTTLEKLTTFKYKPVANSRTINDSTPALQSLKVGKQDDMLLNEQVRHEEAHAPSEYDDLLSSEFPYNEALWGIKVKPNHTDSDALLAGYATNMNPRHDLCSGGMGLEQGASKYDSGTLEGHRERSVEKVMDTTPSSACNLARSPDVVDLCQYDVAYYEPTFSEAVVFGDLLNSCDIDVEKLAQETFSMHESTVREASMPTSVAADPDNHEMAHLKNASEPYCHLDFQVPAHNLGQGAHSQGTPGYSFDLSHVADHYGVEIGEANGHVLSNEQMTHPTFRNRLLREEESAMVTHKAPETSCGSNRTTVQVERLGIDDVEITTRDSPKRPQSSDEFGEGLDDDELIALVSVVAVPQPRIKNQQEQHKSPKDGAKALPISSADNDDLLTRSDHSLTPQRPREPVMGFLAISSPYVVADPEDEFPMDDEDMEEMLKLPNLPVGTRDVFAPSESVLRAFNQLGNGEVYDSAISFSLAKSHISGISPKKTAELNYTDKPRTIQLHGKPTKPLYVVEEIEWSFIQSDKSGQPAETEIMSDPFVDVRGALIQPIKSCHEVCSTLNKRHSAHTSCIQATCHTAWSVLDDSHEYEALNPFARPDFPAPVPDRCPIIGLSAQTILRTCFRIGEMFKEGARCDSLAQDAVIELFARVTFSSRETGSTKQHFQFADLWHDRPPYPNGVLANYKTSGLAESESKVFLSGNGMMARCLGRLKRHVKNGGWALHVITIRETDWEEVRWTKNIVSHAQVMTEKVM